MQRPTAVVLLTLLVSWAPGFASTKNLQPVDAELPRVLTEEARRQILAAAPLPPASGDRVDVRVRDPQMRVFSGDLFHPATDRSGRYEDPRVPFSDATYKARVAVDVLVRDAAGRVVAGKTFTGKAAQRVRFPPPHPYQSFDSVWELGRRHAGCSYYPDAEHLLRKAVHDALSGDDGAARWLLAQRR